jgi:aminomuconate-semialdehyde/2-hydroxymuconate-6-semialdehyde dehydrogenase
MLEIQNYIDGKIVAPSTDKYLENINPATGKVYSTVPASNHTDVEVAVCAAKEAFISWSQLNKLQRSEYLLKLAHKLEERFEEFAIVETRDNGKPITMSRNVDIPRSIENLKYFAKQSLDFDEESFDDQGYGSNTVNYSPLGVVGCISPWNLPLYLFTWKIAPALAAGCTVVAKPSEVTPMSAYLFSTICAEVLPPGVLNIVHGLGGDVGNAITNHPDIKAISFTGSTATGQIISKQAASSMKRLHLEMGGKNPNIIFSDCDFDKAIETTIKSSFANQGQICLCGSRIYVERPIYEKFKNALIKKIDLLRQGDPEDSTTNQGAIVSKDHFNKIMHCLEVAKSEGAIFLTGGEVNSLTGDNQNGYFIKPTLIEGVNETSLTNTEEIFGPVVTIQSFDTEDEVIRLANSTKYGLAGSIWSQDITKAKRVAKKIQSGIMWINCWLLRDLRTPFGGMKDSGRGREGGKYILKFFSNTQNICVQS